MQENATPGQLLGSTARWTAAVRARESAREDRLFKDPWAAALAGEEGMEWIEGRKEENTVTMAIRTRFFDEFLQCMTFQNPIRQVVLMAAGLDTRAFRLGWPVGTMIYELDQAEVLGYKDQILQSNGAQSYCKRLAIPADLARPWRQLLLQAGFDPELPSIWLLEGFLFYLPDESITQILDQVTSLAAPGSWMGFDINNHTMLTSPWTREWVEMQAKSGAPWIGTMDDPAGFLAERGWKASLTQAGAPDANYGRWTLPVIPVTMPDMPHNWFVTAVKSASQGEEGGL
jgi:methyltransferase (TIGR00027 family)